MYHILSNLSIRKWLFLFSAGFLINFLFLHGYFFFSGNFLDCAFADTPDVVINEIAWMGTTSQYDEWIELYNNSDNQINLEGWKILTPAPDDANLILFTINDRCANSVIDASGFFLIKRTTNSTPGDTVLDIKADCAGSFGGSGLSNTTSERIELKDASGVLIDAVDCSSNSNKWFAGDVNTKQTMERKNTEASTNDLNNWQDSLNSNGTPKVKNSPGAVSQEATSPDSQSSNSTTNNEFATSDASNANQTPKAVAGPDIIALIGQKITFDASLSSDPEDDALSYFWNFGDGMTSDQQTTTHFYQYPGTYIVVLEVSDSANASSDAITITIYPSNVVISEFLPSPAGADDQNEWIEIYNNSNQIINLSGWQLDDEDGGSKSFLFPANTLIAGYQYLVFYRPITKISLNNDNDSARLIYPNGQIAQEIQYQKAKEGRSVALSGSGEYLWTTIPTPGAPNLINSDKQNSQVITNQAEARNYLAQSNNIISEQVYSAQNPSDNTLSAIIPDSSLSGSAEILDKKLISMGKSNSNNVENLSKTAGKNIGQTKPQSQDANFLEQIYHSRNSSFVIIILLISGLGLIAGWAIIKARKRLKH